MPVHFTATTVIVIRAIIAPRPQRATLECGANSTSALSINSIIMRPTSVPAERKRQVGSSCKCRQAFLVVRSGSRGGELVRDAYKLPGSSSPFLTGYRVSGRPNMFATASRRGDFELLTRFNDFNGADETVNQPSYDFEGSSPSSPHKFDFIEEMAPGLPTICDLRHAVRLRATWFVHVAVLMFVSCLFLHSPMNGERCDGEIPGGIPRTEARRGSLENQPIRRGFVGRYASGEADGSCRAWG